eukprot:33862_1
MAEYVFKTINRVSKYNGTNVFQQMHDNISYMKLHQENYINISPSNFQLLLNQCSPQYKQSKQQMGVHKWYMFKAVENKFFSKLVGAALKEHHVNTIDKSTIFHNRALIGRRVYKIANIGNKGFEGVVTAATGNTKVTVQLENGTNIQVTLKSERTNKQLYLLNDHKTLVLTQSIKSYYKLYANPKSLRRKFWIDRNSEPDKMEYIFSDKGKRIECAIRKTYSYVRHGNKISRTHIGQCYQLHDGSYVSVRSIEIFDVETGEEMVEVFKIITGNKVKQLFKQQSKNKAFDPANFMQKYTNMNCPSDVCIMYIGNPQMIPVSKINLAHNNVIVIREWNQYKEDQEPHNCIFYFLAAVYGDSFLEHHLGEYQWKARTSELIKCKSGCPQKWFGRNHHIVQVLIWPDAAAVFDKRNVSINMLMAQFLNVSIKLGKYLDIYHPLCAYPKNILPVDIWNIIYDIVEEDSGTPLKLGDDYFHFLYALMKSDQKEVPFFTNTKDTAYICGSCYDKPWELTDHNRCSFWYPRSAEHQKQLCDNLTTFKSWTDAQSGYKAYDTKRKIHPLMADPSYSIKHDPDHGGTNQFLHRIRATMNISPTFSGRSQPQNKKRNKLMIKIMDIQKLNNMQKPLTWEKNWINPPEYVHNLELDMILNAYIAFTLSLQHWQFQDQFFDTDFGKSMIFLLHTYLYVKCGIKNENICHPSYALYTRKLSSKYISIRPTVKDSLPKRRSKHNDERKETEKAKQNRIKLQSNIDKISKHTTLNKDGLTRMTEHNTEYHALLSMDMIPNSKILSCKNLEKTMSTSKAYAISGTRQNTWHVNCMLGYNKLFLLTYMQEGNTVTDDGQLDPINGTNKLSDSLLKIKGTDGKTISVFVDMRDNSDKPEYNDGFRLSSKIRDSRKLPNLIFTPKNWKLKNIKQDLSQIILSSKQSHLNLRIKCLDVYKCVDIWRNFKRYSIYKGNLIVLKNGQLMLIEYITHVEYHNEKNEVLLIGVVVKRKDYASGGMFKIGQLILKNNLLGVCSIDKVQCIAFYDHIGCEKCQWRISDIIHDFEKSPYIIYLFYIGNGNKPLYFPFFNQGHMHFITKN